MNMIDLGNINVSEILRQHKEYKSNIFEQGTVAKYSEIIQLAHQRCDLLKTGVIDQIPVNGEVLSAVILTKDGARYAYTGKPSPTNSQLYYVYLLQPKDGRYLIANPSERNFWYCNAIKSTPTYPEEVQALINSGWRTYDQLTKDNGNKPVDKNTLNTYFNQRQIGSIVLFQEKTDPTTFRVSVLPEVAQKQQAYINYITQSGQTGECKLNVPPQEQATYRQTRIEGAPKELFPNGLILWCKQAQDITKQSIPKYQKADLQTCKRAVDTYYNMYIQRETTPADTRQLIDLKNFVQFCKNQFHPDRWGPLNDKTRTKVDELTNKVSNYDRVAVQYKLK